MYESLSLTSHSARQFLPHTYLFTKLLLGSIYSRRIGQKRTGLGWIRTNDSRITLRQPPTFIVFLVVSGLSGCVWFVWLCLVLSGLSGLSGCVWLNPVGVRMLGASVLPLNYESVNLFDMSNGRL
ncbi:hypothetical protein BDV96DRAFT_179667 [Lophiotrema nucula]|uniref:Uncharacterized protein n=1 Tax=Lophiotrema nucula TaxID=690887 RepID=A0A6A5YYA3_9PLEO|nr:hypothetical protein BDV96DRAFT_179667 [Lophiotrema nucula]